MTELELGPVGLSLRLATVTVMVQPMSDAPVGAVRPIRIHARDVAIATERPRNLSIRNVLAAKILRIETSATGNVDRCSTSRASTCDRESHATPATNWS